MPFKRFGHCLVNVNSTYVLFFGGFERSLKFQSTLFSYNSISDAWKLLSSDQVPCKTPKVGYQTSCAYLVMNSCNHL